MQNFIRCLGVAMCVSLAIPVFADPAPVYDADNLQDDNIGAYQYQPQTYPAPAQAPQASAFQPAQQEGAVGGQEDGFASNQASPVPLSIDQRMRRVEQQMSNMQNNEATARIESLQRQVQSLRGQVEQLTHDLQQTQTEQKNIYTEFDKFDKRLSEEMRRYQSARAASAHPTQTAASAATSQEGTPAPVSKTRKTKVRTVDPADKLAAKASAEQPNVAEEQQIYQTAYNLIKAKKYDEAVSALQGMLKKYPSGQFAANAHYWLGELYGLMGKNDLALSEFSAVVKTFPDSPRVSDAQLKVGLIYASQTKWSDARSAFKKVINQYPGTASARLAVEQLKQLKLAGH